jgi:predicted cobalt transporter CbtA
MTGRLLLRGLLVGLVAGVLSFGFLRAFGEPGVDRAISFETRMEEARIADARAKGVSVPEPEAELVSRPVQSGIGLFTGVAVYGTALGGLFALAFAAAYGRAGGFGLRATSALLGLAGFVSIHLVPNLKYPANPPSVGEPETIRLRTALYFAMILISLIGMIAACGLRGRLLGRFGGWNASIAAGAAYLAVVALAVAALPGVNEVPEQFPAVVLWQFRIASLGAQALLWTVLGLGFGAVLEHRSLGLRPLLLRAA